MAPICQRKCWFPHAPHTLCGKPPASRLQASRWAILTAKRHCVAWIYSPKQSGSRQESRSEEHTSELQSHHDLVCRLLLEKKNKHTTIKLILHKQKTSHTQHTHKHH